MTQEDIYPNTYDRFTINKYLKDKLSRLDHKETIHQRNETIVEAGEPITSIALVEEGTVTVLFNGIQGEKAANYYIYPGQIFPVWVVFSGLEAYPFELKAQKKSKLYWYPLDAFMDLVEMDNNAAVSLLEYMAEWGYSEALWKRCNQHKTVRQKVIAMLFYIYQAGEKKRIKLLDTQDVLANKLQVSRPSLNQEINRLEEEGLIQRNNREISILDERALKSEL